MADTDIQQAVRETLSLLDKEDLTDLSSYKANTPEKEIASEYVTSYAQFIADIVEKDLLRGVQRPDYEMRELVGHINAMLKQKQPDIFMKMLMMCPKHYLAFFNADSNPRITKKPASEERPNPPHTEKKG